MSNEINLESDEVLELEVLQNRKLIIFFLCGLFFSFCALLSVSYDKDPKFALFCSIVVISGFYTFLTLWAKKMLITNKRIIFYGLWKNKQMKREALEKVFAKKIFCIAHIHFWGINENKKQIITFPFVSHFSSIKEKLEEILGKEIQ